MSAVAATTPLSVTDLPALSCRRGATLISFIVADFLALSVSGSAAVFLRYVLNGKFVPAEYLPFVPALLLFFGVFAALGLYPGIGVNPVSEFRRIVVGTGISYLLIIAATFFAKESASYSRIIFLFAAVLGGVLLLTFRFVLRRVCSAKAWWGIPTVILGAGETGQGVFKILISQPKLGFRPIAVLDRDVEGLELPDLSPKTIVGDLSLAPVFARMHRSCYAIVTMPDLTSQQLADVVSEYAGGFSHVLLIPDFFGFSSLWVSAKDVGGVLGLEVSQILVHRLPQLIKRAFDLVIGIGGSIFLLPLLLILYIAVRVSSSGPVLYGQRRVGRGGCGFTAWKFRSMVMDADEILHLHLSRDPELGAQWRRDHKLKNDPRVTRVGKFLRKTSLDELPQIWNVLRGEMSLVGPRPIVKAEIAKYGKRYELYCKVRPGITGMWQISGRNNTTYEARIQFDEYYVRNWSVWLDLYILMRTVKTVSLAQGAY